MPLPANYLYLHKPKNVSTTFVKATGISGTHNKPILTKNYSKIKNAMTKKQLTEINKVFGPT